MPVNFRARNVLFYAFTIDLYQLFNVPLAACFALNSRLAFRK